MCSQLHNQICRFIDTQIQIKKEKKQNDPPVVMDNWLQLAPGCPPKSKNARVPCIK